MHNRSLDHLFLWENNFNDEALAMLARGLRSNPTLKHLDLSFNPCGHQRGVRLFLIYWFVLKS